MQAGRITPHHRSLPGPLHTSTRPAGVEGRRKVREEGVAMGARWGAPYNTDYQERSMRLKKGCPQKKPSWHDRKVRPQSNLAKVSDPQLAMRRACLSAKDAKELPVNLSNSTACNWTSRLPGGGVHSGPLLQPPSSPSLHPVPFPLTALRTPPLLASPAPRPLPS